tara:strand:+ start:258 stop:944 length:687 start_codon:yes stop_codon:yes gene_type:complete
MTKIIGNPEKNNALLKKIINKPIIHEKYIANDLEFRDEVISEIKNDMHVLDIGKSMRGKYEEILCKNKKTLDINLFEDYPDYQCDLSQDQTIINSELQNKFDIIICLAVLEHVYNPFTAMKNIRSMLKKNGILFGYVPFLYHYHAPSNLEFQDYFRFTKDALSYLLKDFNEVKLYPVRGRISTSMHILMGSVWKRVFEKFGLNKYLDRFSSPKKNIMQCSGYNFIAKI